MATITVAPVVLRHQKRRDGTWNVKIRVTFRGESRYIPTTITATAVDLTRGMGFKSDAIRNKVSPVMVSVREAISSIPTFSLEGRSVDWVVEKIRGVLSGEDFRLGFIAFGRDWATRKKTGTTRQAYLQALAALERFTGGEVDVNAITKAMLLKFAEADEAAPKMRRSKDGEIVGREGTRKLPGASARHLAKLAAIFREAKSQYNDEDAGIIRIPRSPFDGVSRKQPVSTGGQKPLPVELLQQMVDARPADPLVREALDLFLLSFACMGVNLADLHEARPLKENAVWWVYNRKKVRDRRPDGAEVRVKMTPEVSALLGRLQNGPSGWMVPALHRIGTTAARATASVNKRLRKWCDAVEVPPFTFGAARHSWATITRRLGVEKATVDEGMGHVGDFAVLDIYAERDWEQPAEANRKVLDLLSWENF